MGVSRLLPGPIHQPHTGTDLSAGRTTWDKQKHTRYIQMFSKQTADSPSVPQMSSLKLHACIKKPLYRCKLSTLSLSEDWQHLTWHPPPDLYILLYVPMAFFFHRSQPPLCYFATESFTPDSICRLAATVVPVRSAAPARAKLAWASVGMRPANFPPVASTRKKIKDEEGKKYIHTDEVQGSISHEAPHFHLGAKWF